jgi:hypothetical protein
MLGALRRLGRGHRFNLSVPVRADLIVPQAGDASSPSGGEHAPRLLPVLIFAAPPSTPREWHDSKPYIEPNRPRSIGIRVVAESVGAGPWSGTESSERGA